MCKYVSISCDGIIVAQFRFIRQRERFKAKEPAGKRDGRNYKKEHNKAAKLQPNENANAYIMLLNSHWIIKIVESNGLAAAFYYQCGTVFCWNSSFRVCTCTLSSFFLIRDCIAFPIKFISSCMQQCCSWIAWKIGYSNLLIHSFVCFGFSLVTPTVCNVCDLRIHRQVNVSLNLVSYFKFFVGECTGGECTIYTIAFYGLYGMQYA